MKKQKEAKSKILPKKQLAEEVWQDNRRSGEKQQSRGAEGIYFSGLCFCRIRNVKRAGKKRGEIAHMNAASTRANMEMGSGEKTTTKIERGTYGRIHYFVLSGVTQRGERPPKIPAMSRLLG